MKRADPWVSRLFVIAAVLAGATVALGCTVIRYVDGEDDPIEGPPPKEIDLLVMMDMSRPTANLVQDYGNILGGITFALAQSNVTIRHAALAPLHSRAGGAVPLLYGEGDEQGEFFSFEEAVAFYTYDGGAEYLQDAASAEAENLAILGRELDTRPIYRPTAADTDARAYFSEPTDGFVILYFSASPRRCAMGSSSCAIEGTDPVDYFTDTDGAGVTWLELPGGASLPRGKVFHGAIVTAENVDYQTFYDTCSTLPNFPVAKLDVMQPSPDEFFGPFVDEVNAAGGVAHYTDLCDAMSRRMETSVSQIAAAIRSML